MNRLLAVVAASISLSFACATATGTAPVKKEPQSTEPGAHEARAKGALAQIESRSGSSLVGTARFNAHEGGGVSAHIVIAGATPGDHGVHIHENGDCSNPKAESAGGHFNPHDAKHHGSIQGADRHGGDLGNITADAAGNGTLDVVIPGVSMAGENTGIVNRSIVVHEKTDDLHSDPAGNSGSRIGCGVITGEP